jgi:alkylation response protein AidB-like acyl-CoA dehydrogenase
VDLTLNEDQEALRHSVRAVLAGECPPAVARDALTDPECWRPLWKTAVDLGWTALALQEEAAGLGLVELVVVIEDCGAALLPAPLLSTAGLAGGALAAAGTATYALRQELAEGAVGALIASQPGARLPGPAAAYDGRVLRGTGGQVIDADRADLIVVLAEDLSGDNILAVVRPGPGVDILPSHAVDGARPLADVILDVMPELVVPCSLAEALAVPLTAAAADLLGVAARALDLAVGHALDREQFGRKIGLSRYECGSVWASFVRQQEFDGSARQHH